VLETVIITLMGALLGVVLGALASWYFVVNGLNLSAFGDVGDFQYMGVSFGSSIPFRVDFWVLAKPVLYITPVAVLCGILPARNAATVHITNAISGRS
jgi:ABC-type antimicrobial peptide transport system permease subunit